MRRGRQRGVALLAVSLVLVIVGALAYMMTRQAAMAANSVNAQYDAEVARYLAEAGLNVAEWRDQQVGCKKNDTLVKTSRIDAGGTYSAFIKDGDKQLIIDAVGTSSDGARVAWNRKAVIAHDNELREITLLIDKGEGTTISSTVPTTPQYSQPRLELTKGSSSVLMQFIFPGEVTRGMIVKAELTLTQDPAIAVPANQVVSVHRVTRDWDAKEATWLKARSATPWASAGGDYTPGNVATAVVANGTFKWDVTALVDGWSSNAFSNFGLLLQVDGTINQARFYGFQDVVYRPTMRVQYTKAC